MAVAAWKVSLTLEGPIMTKASAAGRAGVDAVMARAPGEGKWCLPGSLVKGRLRQAWRELREICGSEFDPPIEELLGDETGNEEKPGNVSPARGRLHFSDLSCEGEACHPGAADDPPPLYRIRMDRERGSVDRGAFFVLEAPFAVGQLVIFTGTVRSLFPETDGRVEHYLRKGFSWIPSIGAQRTVSFGKVIAVAVEPLPEKRAQPHTNHGDWLLLVPDGPFCIAKRKVAGNVFEAEEIIPGGVIKGCLASTWAGRLGKPSDSPVEEEFDRSLPELSRHFWAVRFTHAFPLYEGNRPVVEPLSLAHFGNEGFRDLALENDPSVVRNGKAPAFAVDWKEPVAGVVHDHFGWPRLERDLRVRTAIDGEKRRADDKKLFSCETVVPRNTRWGARVDLSQIPNPDRTKVEEQLWGLLGGVLLGFGKTKCPVDSERSTSVTARMKSDPAPIDGRWVLTLQSPSLLCDPSGLNETSGREELWAAYQTTWQELSGGLLGLERYFARQSLAGGFYLHGRFQAGRRYRPYLLTDAGSVFVLRGGKDDAKAEALIANWLCTGLPLPQWAVESYAGTNRTQQWKHCPYLPENGFGEIAVNLPVHTGSDLPAGGES